MYILYLWICFYTFVVQVYIVKHKKSCVNLFWIENHWAKIHENNIHLNSIHDIHLISWPERKLNKMVLLNTCFSITSKILAIKVVFVTYRVVGVIKNNLICMTLLLNSLFLSWGEWDLKKLLYNILFTWKRMLILKNSSFRYFQKLYLLVTFYQICCTF